MFASSKDRFERANHCQHCEHYRKSTRQCNLCGCLVSIKVAWASSTCPANKWGEVKPGSFPSVIQFFKRAK